MWLVHAALRRPITVLVLVIAMALLSFVAIGRTRVDIFPDLNIPTIYVAQPYGGMSPQQIEGFISYYYEYHFLYIDGIESVEARSIQGTALLRLNFHPGTDMSQALAQTISYVNRAKAFMPPGTVPPFIIRYDAGTLPVGYLVFSSPTRTLAEMQDLALNRVRPQFATLAGVSSPPPFGASQRTIVLDVDPQKLQSYGRSPADVVQALATGNSIQPAGNADIGTTNTLVTTNSTVVDYQDLLDIPLQLGPGKSVYMRDVATIADSADLLAGYALRNGKRTIYIPVTKRPDASTITVVDAVKQSLPRFQSLLPDDVHVDYELDQSAYVRAALSSVLREASIGAALTGLMLFLFLRDWRSSLIVVMTIPFALLSAVVALRLAGQTINIMTLGGLALAVGVLVDEGTVLLENIHVHLDGAETKARAVLAASREVATPRLLAMLSVFAVFLPAFFMSGPAQSLFLPLSLAVGFSMGASYLLSSSLVPVLANWMLREVHATGASEEAAPPKKEPAFVRFRHRFEEVLTRVMRYPILLLAGYAIVAALVLGLVAPRLPQEVFPSSASKQFRLRVDAPDGTRVAVTEDRVRRALEAITEEAGENNLDLSLGYVGTQASSYPINAVFLWTSGPQQAVINIGLKRDSHLELGELKERLRARLSRDLPDLRFSFDPGDLVSQILNFGAPSQAEVAVTGPQYGDAKAYAERVREQLGKVESLRDVGFEEPLHYPTVNVKIDRTLAGQLGATANDAAAAVVSSTGSSRFIAPNFWRDPKSGVSYQVQIQVPQPQMTSIQDIANIPVSSSTGASPLLRQLAALEPTTVPGELDRKNGLWMLSLSANVASNDVGGAARDIGTALDRVGAAPRGVKVEVRGQVNALRQIFGELAIGLGAAVGIILLVLTANFQSVRLAFVVLSTAPAVLVGVVLMLIITGTSVNLESFMGTIMAIGVAVANAILLVTFAEKNRRNGADSHDAARGAATERLRPVLMTSLAMIAGMVPMALAIGEGSEETAPLGRAVIGGLSMATLATLFLLPTVFGIVQRKAPTASRSLDPEDPESRFNEARSAT
ncbi:Cobalt-zinc-cadmium resistance protein CzcA [Labilithrix luteola]|uniref:Cobalt-zinc-cadmium resistance protein CzcA n=1 Tax=Labilithrix luteola TaxID=1391654 RepID=A0A0K1Q4G5_9BACT|nr:efflux RND transporter permease subunit [Labilithrix luteola]AKV00275.1 Cobalt-zinc-cadmium resistance protein CzcA [Labilithrix luteola]